MGERERKGRDKTLREWHDLGWAWGKRELEEERRGRRWENRDGGEEVVKKLKEGTRALRSALKFHRKSHHWWEQL